MHNLGWALLEYYAITNWALNGIIECKPIAYRVFPPIFFNITSLPIDWQIIGSSYYPLALVRIEPESTYNGLTAEDKARYLEWIRQAQKAGIGVNIELSNAVFSYYMRAPEAGEQLETQLGRHPQNDEMIYAFISKLAME